MKRDVLVSISGVQSDISDDATSVMLPGQYYKRNGAHYIKYEQYDDDSKTVLNNLIKIKDTTVELKKTGIQNVRMYFQKDRRFTSYYDLKEGSMIVETMTGNIDVKEQEDSLKVVLEYELYVNSQFVSECTVAIDIVERNCSKK